MFKLIQRVGNILTAALAILISTIVVVAVLAFVGSLIYHLPQLLEQLPLLAGAIGAYFVGGFVILIPVLGAFWLYERAR